MKPWQSSARTQLLAVALGPFPIYVFAVVGDLLFEQPYSPHEFVWYLSAFSMAIILFLLLLLRLLCGEKPRDLNLKTAPWTSDLVAAGALSVVIVVANDLAIDLLSRVLPASPPNTAILDFFTWLSQEPGRLALFLVVLLWIGAAQEELTRVFLLSRLWRVWPSATGKWIALLLSSVLFGLAHFYQGPVRIIWTGLAGLIMGAYYLRFGRVAPLVIAHYFSDALQVVFFALRNPPGTS